MNILKKLVACFAAATVMTSMAVTASAEYQISGIASKDKYYLRVVGLPETLVYHSDYEVISTTLTFQDHDKAIFINVDRTDDYRVDCFVADKDHDQLGSMKCELLTFEGFGGELGLMIEFSADNEYLAEFMKHNTVGVMFFGTDWEDSGTKNIWFDSNGEEMYFGYTEPCTVTWETLNSSEDSQPTQSETTSSEPAPESTSSEPAPESTSSEPAPEPVSSEPVSEPVSSEPSTSQPTNVDTGVAGIAAVVGNAILAAGAVIVTRKKK